MSLLHLTAFIHLTCGKLCKPRPECLEAKLTVPFVIRTQCATSIVGRWSKTATPVSAFGTQLIPCVLLAAPWSRDILKRVHVDFGPPISIVEPHIMRLVWVRDEEFDLGEEDAVLW